MTSLWQLFDERLVAQGEALDGIVTAAVGDVANIDEENMPLLLVRSGDAALSTGRHGDGQVHREASYRYVLAVFEESDSYADAKALAQGRQLALEGLMFDAGLYGLVGDGNERLQRVEPGDCYIEVRQGVSADRHLGACGLHFTLHTER